MEILLSIGADVEVVGGALKIAIGGCMLSITPNPDFIQILLERVKAIYPDVDRIPNWTPMEGHLPVVRTVMSKKDCVRTDDKFFYAGFFRKS